MVSLSVPGAMDPRKDGSVGKTSVDFNSPSNAPDESTAFNGAPDAESPRQKLTSRAHAPPLGSRIQVLWRIVYNESNSTSTTPLKQQVSEQPTQHQQTEPVESTRAGEADVVERWWGAVVQDCTPDFVGSRDPAHADYNVFVLLYDSYGEFEEETSRVAFLPGNVLLDLSMLHDEDGGRLDWRLESDVDMEMSMDTDDLSTFAMSPLRTTELSRFADDLASQSDVPADADLRALATMPYNVQLRVTSGYRSFADSLKAQLGQLLSSKPSDYVVTADDIHDVMSRVRSDQRGYDNTLAASNRM